MALSFQPNAAVMEIPQSFYEAITRTGNPIPTNPIFKGLTRSPADYEQSTDSIPDEIKQLNIARGLIQANLFTRADDHVDKIVKSSLGLSNRVAKLHGAKIVSQRNAQNTILGESGKPSSLKEMGDRKE